MTNINNTEYAVEINGLYKSFGENESRVDVIKNLNFSLENGQFETIMGPSGSGKSTLLHLIAGLLSTDKGTIKIGGQEITSMNDRNMTIFRRKKIGLIFQDFNLVPTLSAEENIALPLLLDNNYAGQERIEQLMDLLGITSRRKHLPAKLSGGEKQRVAIARALAGSPAVVLADEPTGNLDSPAANEFCGLMKTLNKETKCTILMVSHDPVVASAANHVHILKDGIFVDTFATEFNPQRVSEHYVKAMEINGSR